MHKRIFLLLILLLTTLSSCSLSQDYDSIYSDFDAYITENQEIYNERIDFINHISTDLIKGVVKVKRNSSDKLTVTLGSGLIIDEDSIFYYVLTNNHVVYDKDISHATYTINDYQNNVYNAIYLVGSNDYDLAVLRIRKIPGIKLNFFVFAKEQMEENQPLTTLGYPESQLNALNMGVLLDYGPITIDIPSTVINIDFDVMKTDAPVKTGSSGSAAINNQYELVGVVFAGNFEGGSNIADFAYLLPLDKVKEFLNLNEIDFKEATT